MQESSWNNLIPIPLVIFNGFQDELVSLCSFFPYKFGVEPSWIFSPIKSPVFAKTEASRTVPKSFMQMNKTMKTGGLNVCYSYIFLQVMIVISLLKTARFRKKWLYSNKYLFIKLPVTEVEHELLKCLWGAGLFFLCQVSVKNKKQQEKMQHERQNGKINGPSPADRGTESPKSASKARALSPAGQGWGLPKEASWEFPALIDLCKAEACISLENKRKFGWGWEHQQCKGKGRRVFQHRTKEGGEGSGLWGRVASACLWKAQCTPQFPSNKRI